MLSALRFILIALTLAISLGCAAAQGPKVPDDSTGSAMLQEAQRQVAAWHAGQPPAAHTLRVVYFVPQDSGPLPDYESRLDRIVSDVNAFYREGLQRFGISSPGLPLERHDGRLVVHLVRGKLPAREYHYESGRQTGEEIRRALQDSMDISRESLLVFYALCEKGADGRYIFTAPYYGSGSQRGGICHAADCEVLDPRLLTDTKNHIVYTEHYYPRQEQTLARFNSWYLGGVAHELGHGLGLAHDAGSNEEQAFGTSLMGYGNTAYRQEVWGGSPPAFLSRASALQLISHPLLTGSDRGRWDKADSDFQSLVFSQANGKLRVRGSVTGAIPPYAVVATVWPESDQVDDHAARTFPCVLQNEAFTLDVDGLPLDRWHRFHLKLTRLHVNGAAPSEQFPLTYDDSATADTAALNARWPDRAALAIMQRRPTARDYLKAAVPSTEEATRKLAVLREVLDPVQPIDLGTATGKSAFLSDTAWTDARVGWGQVARNHFWFDEQNQNGVFLLLGGQFFDKGLYAHSSSQFVFPVNGQWKTFTATVGLRDGAGPRGSAIFTVLGDGRELFRSPLLRVGQRAEVEISISEVKQLDLRAEGGEGHNGNSWAIWANPQVQR